MLLLHVFPTRSKGLPLIEAMKKLIIFRLVSCKGFDFHGFIEKKNRFLFQIGTPPQEMIEKDNTHPYIVAYGTSIKEIISFYIEVERHLIPVSITFV